MNWMVALLWFGAGIILAALFALYLERLVYRHGRIMAITVCERPGCDKLHITMGILFKGGETIVHNEHAAAPCVGFSDPAPMSFAVPMSIRISDAVRKALLDQFVQIRVMKELADRAEPYDTLSASNLAAWNIMREQDDVSLQKMMSFIENHEKILSSAEVVSDKKEKMSATDCAYFRSMIQDVLELRSEDGIFVQRGKVIGEPKGQENA